MPLDPRVKIFQFYAVFDWESYGTDPYCIHSARDSRNPLLAASETSPSATASYSVAAVTVTVCSTPSMSLIVTRQDREGMSEA